MDTYIIVYLCSILHRLNAKQMKPNTKEHIFVWVLWETGAKMELDVQDLLGEKPEKNKRGGSRNNRGEQAWQAFTSQCRSKTCERREGGKHQVGRISDCSTVISAKPPWAQVVYWRGPCQAGVDRRSHSCHTQPLVGSSTGKLDLQSGS